MGFQNMLKHCTFFLFLSTLCPHQQHATGFTFNTNSKIDSDEERSDVFGVADPVRIKRRLCSNTTEETLDLVRYDATAAQCSPVGHQGHCGDNMRFYGVTHNNIYGECDCLYNSPRPLIFHLETKRCHYIYDQAYCRRGEWLTFDVDGRVGCEFNKCQTPTVLPERVYVPLNGTGPCVLLGQHSVHCEEAKEVVSFVQGHLTPKCTKLIQGTRALALSRQLTCNPGTYLNIVGKCQPPFVW